ncbi:phage filamentation protein Fil family protein [Klebsiella pneumoniae]
MLTNEPSFVSLLKKRSPSMHYGHGWIMGSDGQRWHPCCSQSELLNGLTAKKVSAVKRLLNALMGAK